MTKPASSSRDEHAAGLLYAGAGFLVWGISPVFWKLILHVPAMEMLAHRVLWCGILMAGLLLVRRERGLVAALSQPRTFFTLVFSTLLIASNWFVYIYSVVTDRILHASLGYFINPLVTVLLGVVFLGEELRPRQRWAVAIAAVGVAILTWRLGELPWISLALASTFAVYGLVRKTVQATPEQGLALETWLLAPLALFYLISQHAKGFGTFTHHGLFTDLMLVATGLLTATPLLLFTHGARRLPLSTIGLLQYLAPTCQFLLAVLVYREPFDRVQLIAFACIWSALALFTVDLRQAMRRRAVIVDPRRELGDPVQ